MKTIQIEIPDGKKAEWVGGVLTLVDELPQKEAPQTFVPDSLIAAYAAEVEQSNLFKYLANLWPLDTVLQVMRQYKVGRYSKSLCGCAAASVFPSIDVDGRVTAYKAIPYPENSHHRIKAAKGSNDKDVYWHVPQGCKACYFGLHLLPSMPDKPVALVESEKTAIVGALDCPEYVWIATQGITQIDAAKLAPLKGRTIHLFPDADGLKDWRNKAVEMRQDGHTVKVRDEIIKRLDPKSKLDIGDVLLYARRKQIIKDFCTLTFNALKLPISWHDEASSGKLFNKPAGTVNANTGYVSTGIHFKHGEEDWVYWICDIVDVAMAMTGKKSASIAEVLKLIDYLVAFHKGEDLIKFEQQYEEKTKANESSAAKKGGQQ